MGQILILEDLNVGSAGIVKKSYHSISSNSMRILCVSFGWKKITLLPFAPTKGSPNFRIPKLVN